MTVSYWQLPKFPHSFSIYAYDPIVKAVEPNLVLDSSVARKRVPTPNISVVRTQGITPVNFYLEPL